MRALFMKLMSRDARPSSSASKKESPVKKEAINREKDVDIGVGDLTSSLVAMLDKKTRNLEKRRAKGLQLKQLLDQGKPLNADQILSVQSIKEVESNLELIKEITASLSEIRVECLSELKKQEQNPTSNGNQTKADSIKHILEYQNSFKKLAANANQIRQLDVKDDRVLTSDEVDKLIAFWELISPVSTPEPPSRIKKVSNHFSLFLAKDSKLVSSELGVTYAQLNSLCHKIGSSIYCLKSQNSKEDEAVKEVEVPIPVPAVAVPSAVDNSTSVSQDRPKSPNDRFVKRRGRGRNWRDPKPRSSEPTTSSKVGTQITVRDVTTQYRGRNSATRRFENGHAHRSSRMGPDSMPKVVQTATSQND